jgi:hypothetical protein
MSDRLTVHETELITVWCYPTKRIIHHQMHKPIYGHALHEALLKGIDAMRQHRGSKWLSDDRANGALPPEDLEWGDKIWFPMTVKAGWKFWALVQPEKVIGQMNMRRFVKLYGDRGVTVQVFSDPDEAMAWLEKQ